MSEIALTPLQVAQRELLAAGVSSSPADNANAAQINGLLMSCRVSALVELVGQGSPDFQKLFDEACLAQVQKLTEQIKAINVKPKIALAS
jgi:hypothetical protein